MTYLATRPAARLPVRRGQKVYAARTILSSRTVDIERSTGTPLERVLRSLRGSAARRYDRTNPCDAKNTRREVLFARGVGGSKWKRTINMRNAVHDGKCK